MLERLINRSSQNRRLVATVVCLTLTFYPDLEASSDPDMAVSATLATASKANLCEDNPKNTGPLELCFRPERWLATGTRTTATFAPSALFLPPIPGSAVNY